MLITLANFKGELPRLHPRMLPADYAARATNLRFEDGTLKPIHAHTSVQDLAPGIETIFKHNDDWLAWTVDMDVVPGPVDQDRLYLSYEGADPLLRYDDTDYLLALHPPAAAPLVTNLTVPDPLLIENVLFCYTFVTDLGEESARSPIFDLQTDNAVTVQISGFSAPQANRRVTHIRIYRSITSIEGITDFYFAVEIPYDQPAVNHDIGTVPLQEVLPTKDFYTPPTGLRGLTSMPNGMIAGFLGKKIYFCEPYQPHAWPEKYILTVDYDIVGLAAFGTFLIVLTEGTPYRMQGTHPDVMIMEQIELNMPCVSKRSIVDLGYSALYASSEGLVEITSENAQVVTKGMLSKQDWAELVPSSIVATEYRQAYVFTFGGSLYGGSEKMATIQMAGDAAWIVRFDHDPDAFFYDRQAGELFIAEADEVRLFDDISAADTPANRKTMLWRGKEVVLPAPTNFAAFFAESEETTGTFTARLYGDGVLRDTITVADEPVRLSSGYLASRWVIEIEGTRQMSSFRLASEMQSLWSEAGT